MPQIIVAPDYNQDYEASVWHNWKEKVHKPAVPYVELPITGIQLPLSVDSVQVTYTNDLFAETTTIKKRQLYHRGNTAYLCLPKPSELFKGSVKVRVETFKNFFLFKRKYADLNFNLELE
jgi:hypothetical protein